MCTIIAVPYTPIKIHFGYHTEAPTVLTKVIDATTLIGYVPSFGKIVGIARMIFSAILYTYYRNKFTPEYFQSRYIPESYRDKYISESLEIEMCTSFFFRGVLEACTFFNPVFNGAIAIADLFFTIYPVRSSLT